MIDIFSLNKICKPYYVFLHILLMGDIMNCCCEQNKIIKVINVLFIFLIISAIIVVVIIANNMSNEKNILVAIAVNGDNTQLGTTTIKFSQNDIVIGNALSHVEGTDTISINESGIYQISYQLFGIKEGAGSFNFNAALLINDIVVDSTFNDGPVLEDLVNNRITLTSTVILRLNAGDTLKLSGISIEDIMYQKARIDIEKI